jgi:hypothetical protein
MARTEILTDTMIEEIDLGMGELLTELLRGHTDPEDFVECIMDVITAVDAGDLAQLRSFIDDPLLGRASTMTPRGNL